MTAGNPAPQSPLVAPISWADLIGEARKLLNPTPPATGVTDAAIRRAVSTAYYAMFHALLAGNANSLVGPPHNPAAVESWTRIYRNTNHRNAYNRLRDNRGRFSPGVLAFANHFCHLQDERHNADYNPGVSFRSTTALNSINQAEVIIGNFLLADPSEPTLVAALTVIPGSR